MLPPLVPRLDEGRVIERTVAPRWLVYVPVSTGNGEAAAVCRFTNELSADQGSWGAMAPMTDEELQVLVTSNDRWSL